MTSSYTPPRLVSCSRHWNYFYTLRRAQPTPTPVTCTLLAIYLRLCGRALSAEGIKFELSCIHGLLDMACPTTGAQLQRYLSALQWMRNAIPEYTKLIAPLHDSLERVYATVSK